MFLRVHLNALWLNDHSLTQHSDSRLRLESQERVRGLLSLSQRRESCHQITLVALRSVRHLVLSLVSMTPFDLVYKRLEKLYVANWFY